MRYPVIKSVFKCDTATRKNKSNPSNYALNQKFTISWLYVPIYSLAVKKVSMKVPGGNWANCGGTNNEKIKIKISDKELGSYKLCTG